MLIDDGEEADESHTVELDVEMLDELVLILDDTLEVLIELGLLVLMELEELGLDVDDTEEVLIELALDSLSISASETVAVPVTPSGAYSPVTGSFLCQKAASSPLSALIRQ